MDGLSAIVLCAGYGTRLRPITNTLPKPLVPVGDRSVLGHVVARLRAAGLERIVVNTHHVREGFEDATMTALGVRRTFEPRILGTAGGVANAAHELGDGDVLAHNGDILAELDLLELIARHRATGAFATLALCALPSEAQQRGTVGLDAAAQVVRLRECELGGELSSADFVGVQVLSGRARALLPRDGCLVGDVYIPALERGDTIIGAEVTARWSDIGTPRAYLEANLAWLKDRPHWTHPSARVAPSVALERAIVGHGAQVSGHGALREVVVLPGASATAPLKRALVLADGQIVRPTRA